MAARTLIGQLTSIDLLKTTELEEEFSSLLETCWRAELKSLCQHFNVAGKFDFRLFRAEYMSMKSLSLCPEEEEAEVFISSRRPHGPITSRKRKLTDVAENAKRHCCRSESTRVSESSSGEAPFLEIAVQPEKYFRARYISEGSRGPMRGGKDSAYPTVKICGYAGPAIVDVYLSSPDGEIHDNVLVLGTNSNGAGEVVTVDGGLQCIRVHTSTASSMDAVFSNISVRRLRKFEIDAALRKRGLDPESHDCDRTVACLKFVARIPGHGDVSALSDTFQCSSQPGAPEILLVCPSTGNAAGGDSIALVGKRFKSGFKVRFFASTDQGHWETWASVNRDISNQGAAVIKLPQFGDGEVFMAKKVQIEIRIGPEREPYISEPAEFTYLPLKDLEPACHTTTVTQSMALCATLPPTPVSRGGSCSPPTPVLQGVRGGSCSPAPGSSNSSDHDPMRIASSSSWGAMIADGILNSLSSTSTDPDLFPSNASNASSSILSDIASWSDFPLFPSYQYELGLQSPVAVTEAPDFGEFQDWSIIQRVVSEFTSSFPAESNLLACHLNSLVSQRCPLLHQIYKKCYQYSVEVVDSSPSFLMQRQLNLYLPLLQGL